MDNTNYVAKQCYSLYRTVCVYDGRLACMAELAIIHEKLSIWHLKVKFALIHRHVSFAVVSSIELCLSKPVPFKFAIPSTHN